MQDWSVSAAPHSWPPFAHTHNTTELLANTASCDCHIPPFPPPWPLLVTHLVPDSHAQCSDIDGTMVSDSQDEKEKYWGLVRTAEFQTYWEDNAALAGGVLVYNTGRSKGQLVYLLGERPQLAVPDVCITAVGTKVGGRAGGVGGFLRGGGRAACPGGAWGMMSAAGHCSYRSPATQPVAGAGSRLEAASTLDPVPSLTTPSRLPAWPTALALPASPPPLRLQIWYLPEGKRAFSDPTQVEWIEDKTWARVLDEDWDISKVGPGGGGGGSRGCVRVNDTEEAARATTAQGQVQEARVCLWMWMGQPN